jgi:transcriptional regulator with XRE-family HTH domain
MSKAGAVLDVTPRQALEPWESKLGLSPRDLASALNIDQRSLSRWVTGQTYPQIEARRRLSQLNGMYSRLLETFTDPNAAREWLSAPSKYLGGMTPADAIRAARIDRAEAALEAFDSGFFV